jgi:hypothetical protein
VGNVLKSLAVVIASKITGALVALGVSAGIVIPLGESAQVSSALTLAVSAVLSVLCQAAVAWAEKQWPTLKDVRPLILRVMIRPHPLAPQPQPAQPAR